MLEPSSIFQNANFYMARPRAHPPREPAATRNETSRPEGFGLLRLEPVPGRGGIVSEHHATTRMALRSLLAGFWGLGGGRSLSRISTASQDMSTTSRDLRRHRCRSSSSSSTWTAWTPRSGRSRRTSTQRRSGRSRSTQAHRRSRGDQWDHPGRNVLRDRAQIGLMVHSFASGRRSNTGSAVPDPKRQPPSPPHCWWNPSTGSELRYEPPKDHFLPCLRA